MPFSPKDLSVLAYATGFTLWHYLCREDLNQSALSNYFDDAKDVFRSGDIVMMSYVREGLTACAWLVVVTVREGGVSAIRVP